MNYKRALGIGLVVYITSFVLGGVASTFLGVDMSQTDLANIPTGMWYASAFIAIFLSFLGGHWYFHGPATAPSLKNGAWLGLVFVVVGFVMDVLMLLPLLLENKNPLTELATYYSLPIFWGTLLLVILSAAYVGHSIQIKKIKITN